MSKRFTKADAEREAAKVWRLIERMRAIGDHSSNVALWLQIPQLFSNGPMASLSRLYIFRFCVSGYCPYDFSWSSEQPTSAEIGCRGASIADWLARADILANRYRFISFDLLLLRGVRRLRIPYELSASEVVTFGRALHRCAMKHPGEGRVTINPEQEFVKSIRGY